MPPSRSSIKKHVPTLKIDRTNNQNPIKVAQLIMKRAAIKIYFHVYQEMISSIKKLITWSIGGIFVTPGDYLEPKLVKSAFGRNHVEYESISDKNKNVLLSGYLSEFRLYWISLIDNIQETNNAHKIEVLV